MTPLRESLLKADHGVVDRVAFVLVRDGIPRERLIRAVGLDESYPYYAQPGRSIASIQAEVCEFLGVSLEWLLTGRESRESRRGSREFSDGRSFVGSALVSGNSAHSIHVHNYCPKERALQ